ncbi:hypothetical protein BKA70DRAFT_712789 [Coprinopsis sp. MPI-PUGE-AT-0042]|nr:hypothetical protein BKA70DRAFT_712789 [Coprinopsis sp. MPI-PUGE-AT-0042]
MSLVYDDRDSVVQYSAGEWGDAGVPEEYKSTTSWTETPGATARVTFTGRGISVVGTITMLGVKDRPVSSYVIDGDSSSRFRFEGEQTDIIQRNKNFYSVSGLDYGEHVLTITNESSEGTLYLDYFEVTGFDDPGTSSSSSPNNPTPNPPSPSDSTTQSGQPSNSPSLPSPSSSQSNAATPLPNRSSSSGVSQSSLTSGSSASGVPAETDQQGASDSSTPVGAIAGGVVGGVAILCIAFLVFVIFRRRHKRKRDLEDLQDGYSGPHMQPVIQPFIAGNDRYAPSGYGAAATHRTLGSGSSQSAGMMGGAHPAYPTAQNPSGYSMPMAAGYNHADNHSTSMRDTASPVPVSSASMVSGYTGGSARHAESQPQYTLTPAGYTVPNKLASNMATVAPNRAAEMDAPPGYQN